MKNLLFASFFLLGTLFAKAQMTGSFQQTITFEEADYNATRTLYFHVPSDYDSAENYPLVVGFRGGPHSNAGQFRDQLTFLADSIGAIIVCPENSAHFWNEESLTKQLFQYSVDTTMAMYNINPDFIYLTGLSYGGRHAVIVALDTDAGPVSAIRGVIPFAAGSESDLQPNYDAVDDFPPACICIGTNDSANFISVSNNLANDINTNGGDALLNEVQGVGHTVAFPTYPAEMMECITFIESHYPGPNAVIHLDQEDNRIQVFPNPATDFVQLSFETSIKPSAIYLVNADGQKLRTFPADAKQLNLAGLPSGTQTLILVTQKELITKQLVLLGK